MPHLPSVSRPLHNHNQTASIAGNSLSYKYGNLSFDGTSGYCRKYGSMANDSIAIRSALLVCVALQFVHCSASQNREQQRSATAWNADADITARVHAASALSPADKRSLQVELRQRIPGIPYLWDSKTAGDALTLAAIGDQDDLDDLISQASLPDESYQDERVMVALQNAIHVLQRRVIVPDSKPNAEQFAIAAGSSGDIQSRTDAAARLTEPEKRRLQDILISRLRDEWGRADIATLGQVGDANAATFLRSREPLKPPELDGFTRSVFDQSILRIERRINTP